MAFVLLLALLTALAPDLASGQSVTVPNVVGQTQADATGTLTAGNLNIGAVTNAVTLTGLNHPGQVISDLVGNVYIADTGDNAIREYVAATGQLKNLVNSGLNAPEGIGIDKAGNIYIADTGNNAIKEWVATTGQVLTLVSTGLNHPTGIVVDRWYQGQYIYFGNQSIQSQGIVYFSDTGNNAVKQWDPSTGQVTTLASSGLNQPTGLGFCIGSGVVVADTGNNAIKSLFYGQVTDLGFQGLNRPTGVVCQAYVDNATDFFNFTPPVDFIPYNNYFIADSGNNAIQYGASQSNGALVTVASGFNGPLGVASDGHNNIWIADTGNNALVELPCYVSYCDIQNETKTTLFQSFPAGSVLSTNPAAGSPANSGSAVNLSIESGPAMLNATGILVSNAGTTGSVFLSAADTVGAWSATAKDSFLYVAPASASGNNSGWIDFTVEPSAATGIQTGTLTIDGLPYTVTQVGSDYAATAELGPAITGNFNTPDGVAVDGFGNVYIADTANNAIKKWSSATQQVTTLISSGLTSPAAVVVDGYGNLYIGDGDTLWKWTATTQQLTAVATKLGGVYGVAIDHAGNVYFSLDFAIQKWTAATQQVSTLVSTTAGFDRGIAVDSSGNVYWATNNATASTINEWDASTAQVTTLVSGGLNGAFGLAIDPSGDVYFSDMNNSAIKEWSSATQQVTTLVTGNPAGATNKFRGLALDLSGNLYYAETSLNLVGQLARAYVSAGSLSEPNTAGSDAMPPVVPATLNLTGTSAPSSDQPWLTIGTVANGVVNFSFDANTTGTSRTGHITVLGVQFTVTQGTQQGQVSVPNVIGQNQAAATTAIAAAGLVVGNVSTASSSTVASGNVISTKPVAGTQVASGSAVDLVLSSGPAAASTSLVIAPTSATYGDSQVALTADLKAGTIPVVNQVLAFSLDGASVGTSSTDANGQAVLTATLSGFAAGQHSISVSFAGTTAYSATSSSAVLTIAKATATVTPNAATKTYGTADPALSGTLIGFLQGDNISAVYTRTSGENVGGSPYTISAVLSPSAALSNYNITYNTAAFTITKAIATVTPNAAGKTYGASDPALSGTINGFILSDGITATYSRAAGENAGTYTISGVLSPAAALANYTITYNTATFTIAKATATVTPNAAGKTYGASDPTLGGTLTGFASSDGITATYSRTAGETVGTYTISGVLSPAAALANYSISYNTALFTINPASQTIIITGVPTTATFGQGPFILSASASSKLPVQLGASGSCVLTGNSLSLSGIGKCSVSAVQSGDADYDAAAAMSSSFMIGAAPTNVIASVPSGTVQYSDTTSFSATILPISAGGQSASGVVQFYLNGAAVGSPVAVNSSGVATLASVQDQLPAGNYAVNAVFSSSNPNFQGNSSATTLVVTQENAVVLYTGDTIALVGGTLNLRATVMDSAAAGYTGISPESGSSATVGDITKIWAAFDVYPAGACGSGTPTTYFAQAAPTGTPGVGTAAIAIHSSTEASDCVLVRLVAGSSGGPNPFYSSPIIEPVGIDFYVNSGEFATGGGWVINPLGTHGNFGFNGRYNSNGSPKGQFVYIYSGTYNGVAANFIVKSNALTGLLFSSKTYPITSTLQGKASLQINRASDGAVLLFSGNYTFDASVTDTGQSGNSGKQFSFILYDTSGIPYYSVPSGTALQGGNVVVHQH